MIQVIENELSKVDLTEELPENDDTQSLHINGEIISALMDPEPSNKAEHHVVALLPLIKEPNRSLSRLYRTNSATITKPTFIGTGIYRDLFILEKIDDALAPDPDNSQRFTYTYNGFDKGVQRFTEKRVFHFVYGELIPQIAKERLANEFMAELRLRCAELSSESTLKLSNDQDYKNASPINMLLQSLLVLRDFENAEHLQYVDIEVNTTQIPMSPKPKFKVYEATASIQMFLPKNKHNESVHLQRCRVTGNHVG